jgi:hypothetical protein
MACGKLTLSPIVPLYAAKVHQHTFWRLVGWVPLLFRYEPHPSVVSPAIDESVPRARSLSNGPVYIIKPKSKIVKHS